MKDKFYITTAIAYTSKKPHIGNMYEIILTDAIARYKRQRGYDVFFLTGTDEHGQKIEEIANEKGITPQQHVDEVAKVIRDMDDLLDCSYDGFIRTTDQQHEKVVKHIFKKLYEQGDIYKGSYEGQYCIPCESFFTESQLVNGCCPDCGAAVQKSSEEAYFFKMSKYQDRLIQYIEDNPNFIEPESRKKEMLNNFLKPGLQDLCVSRTSFKWGIPVDFDPKHVVYVWIDALSNYISAIGYDLDNQSEQYKKLWPADLHVIGKDILRFHTIYWPIMLMALDLPLPKKILGHPWLLFGEDKMSKSKGNVMYADDLAKLFGVDSIRYYLLSEMSFAQDGSITPESLITRYNSDLANTIGNLVNRTVTMANKYFGGVIADKNVTDSFDEELKSTCLDTVSKFTKSMDSYHVSDATDAIMELARRSNKYIDETMPWALAKDETKADRLQTVLYNLIESIRYIAVLLKSITPTTAEEILRQINCTISDYDSLQKFGSGNISKVADAEILFSRIDEKEMTEKIREIYPLVIPQKADIEKPKAEKVKKEKAVEATPGIATLIDFDDFMKVELRVAKVLECEPVPKADKLLQLQLDDGEKTRQVVSGIHTWYEPQDLIGKKVILVSNLKPAKLRGVVSEGMILAADASENDVKVLFVDDSVPCGAKIR
ncbi:MAG: methionine--tRNA ligase [Oscillospiraceae bacterium]